MDESKKLSPSELSLVLGQATLHARLSRDDTYFDGPSHDDFLPGEHRRLSESLMTSSVASLEATLPFAHWVPALLRRWKVETRAMDEDDLDDYAHAAPCLSLAIDGHGRSAEFILKIEDDANTDKHQHVATLLWHRDFLNFGPQSEAAYIGKAKAKLGHAMGSIRQVMQDDADFLHAINQLDAPARRLRAHAWDIEQTRSALKDHILRMTTTIEPPLIRPYRRGEKRSS